VPCAAACCCPPSPVGRVAALRCCQDCACNCAALTLQSQHSSSIMRVGALVGQLCHSGYQKAPRHALRLLAFGWGVCWPFSPAVLCK
jgi:hypothetical protein